MIALEKAKDALDPVENRLDNLAVDIDSLVMLLVHDLAKDLNRFEKMSILELSILGELRDEQRHEDEFDWRHRFRTRPHLMRVFDTLAINLAVLRPRLSS